MKRTAFRVVAKPGFCEGRLVALAIVARIYNGLISALYALSGVVVVIIFALIVSDVMMRLVGLSPWIYASGAVEYGLLWFTMLAAPWLTRIKGHVFIDAITQLLPAAVGRVIAKIVYVICIAAAGTFAWYSGTLLVEAIAANAIDTRAVDMPLWTLLAPLPLGFSLVAIEFARYLVGVDDMYRAARKEGM